MKQGLIMKQGCNLAPFEHFMQWNGWLERQPKLGSQMEQPMDACQVRLASQVRLVYARAQT